MTYDVIYSHGRSSATLLTVYCLFTLHFVGTMSSYDGPQEREAEIITVDEMRESIRLVRLQIATPLSLIIALGTNLVRRRRSER